MSEITTVEIEEYFATVTLNRPEAMHALSKALRSKLFRVMTAIDADPEVRAVVLTGAGTRTFTAGLTGNFPDAATGERWGLVNRVVQPEKLVRTAQALARDMASVDPTILKAYKTLIDEGYADSFGDGLAIENRVSSAVNAAVMPEDLEARRLAGQARGQTQ